MVEMSGLFDFAWTMEPRYYEVDNVQGAVHGNFEKNSYLNIMNNFQNVFFRLFILIKFTLLLIQGNCL